MLIKLFGIVLLIAVICVLIAVIRTLNLKPQTTSYTPSDDIEKSTEYAEKLRKMIQVETVSVRGAPDPDKFRQLHKVMEELFPTVFSTCEKIDIDGNLLVKWEGKNKDLDPIILISHLDVVAAEGEWKYPPYSGTIADGKIWGRGTGDIKNAVFAFYQAAEELIKQGYVPECDVYLGSSCTEEIGGDGAPKIANWFKERGIKLFMLSDEGGAIIQDPVGGVKGNFAAIGIFEKGYGDLKLTAYSNGGHSSAPGKNTPIARLAKMVAEIDNHNPFKVEMSDAVKSMFENLAPYCTNFGLKMVMHNLWLFSGLISRLLPSISAQAAAMLQTTIAFTMQKGSNGYNVLPQEAYVTANLRYAPHENMDRSFEVVKKIADKYDVKVEQVIGNNSSRSLDLNGKPYAITVDTIKKVFPGVGIMPYVVVGGTDSRFYDDVCDNCVRFSPFNLTQQQNAAMHGIDENINIDTLPLAVDYYKEIIRAQRTR